MIKDILHLFENTNQVKLDLAITTLESKGYSKEDILNMFNNIKGFTISDTFISLNPTQLTIAEAGEMLDTLVGLDNLVTTALSFLNKDDLITTRESTRLDVIDEAGYRVFFDGLKRKRFKPEKLVRFCTPERLYEII